MQKIVKTQFLGVVEFSSIFWIQFFKVVGFPSNFWIQCFQGSRISYRFMNFCYYFQKLVGVVVFTKVRGHFGSLGLCKNYYSH